MSTRCRPHQKMHSRGQRSTGPSSTARGQKKRRGLVPGTGTLGPHPPEAWGQGQGDKWCRAAGKGWGGCAPFFVIFFFPTCSRSSPRPSHYLLGNDALWGFLPIPCVRAADFTAPGTRRGEEADPAAIPTKDFTCRRTTSNRSPHSSSPPPGSCQPLPNSTPKPNLLGRQVAAPAM